ncbi:ABC transporter permease [Chitinophagaceae bacterium LWZ2-11]
MKSIWRSIQKNRSVSIINVIGLSVGMAASVLIFLWVQNEVSYNSYHTHADNIYRIENTIKVNKDESWVWECSSYIMGDVFSKELPEVEGMTRLFSSPYVSPSLNVNNEFFAEKKLAYVDNTWFNMFKYDFVEGTAAAFNKNPFSIILTESRAKKFFNSNNVIGKTIIIDSINYTVEAVVKDYPVNSDFKFDVLIPLNAFLSNSQRMGSLKNWNEFNYITFLQLRQGTDVAKVSQKMNSILKDRKKDKDAEMSLVALRDMHFEKGIQNSIFQITDKKIVYIFSILGLLLLVIACINYVNLTTAKAGVRSKEVSIRKIAGADRKSLFLRFMMESIVIASISLLLALVFIAVSLPFYNQLVGNNFKFSLTSALMWKVLLFTFCTATLLTGIYPAILLSSFKPLNVFRGMNVLTVSKGNFRKTLVVFQFTVSVALIICVLIMSSQLRYIQNNETGYNREQVVSIKYPFQYYSPQNEQRKLLAIAALKNELKSQPSIADVTAASEEILDIQSGGSGWVDWDGKDSTFNPSIARLAVDENFANVFKLKLTEGRWFTGTPADEVNCVLNETAANELKINKPIIGQRIKINGKDGQVVGVVKDFHFKDMHTKVSPIIMYIRPSSFGYVFAKINRGKTSAAMDIIEKNWKKILPAQPFEYNFLDDTFNNLYKADTKTSNLMFTFSLLAVFISILGLFGLAAFSAEQRTKEIGIRKILGATVSNITLLLSKDFVRLVAVAIIVASPIAYWGMHIWLQDFVYRINIGWWFFVAAALIALIIAVATISIQAIKAAVANPVKSLRTE